MLNSAPSGPVAAYILCDGAVVDTADFPKLEGTSRIPEAWERLDPVRPVNYAVVSGETSVEGFVEGNQFDLLVRTWSEWEERCWFNLSESPFVLGESPEPYAFFLSWSVAGDMETPAVRGEGWSAVSSVPEPSVPPMILAGVLILKAFCRRKRPRAIAARGRFW